MKRPYRIVTPYRAFPPESAQHRALPNFDWIDALRMVTHTARLSNQCEVRVLTDESTSVPMAALRYPTIATRLTLWILEIRLRYLESPAFDRDTVTVDADELIYRDLSPWFSSADLTVLIRTGEKHQRPDAWPLLNGVQWWRVRAKKKLVAFYQEALRIAEGLSEDRLVWGAETDAVRSLLEPLQLGHQKRSLVRVEMVEADDVLETFGTSHLHALQADALPWPKRPILDFRWLRKAHMRAVYDTTILAGAAV